MIAARRSAERYRSTLQEPDTMSSCSFSGLKHAASILLAVLAVAAFVPAAMADARVDSILEMSETVRRAGRPADALRILDLAEPLIRATASPVERARLRLQRATCAQSLSRLAVDAVDRSVEELRAILGAAESLRDARLVADVRDQLGLAIYTRNFRQSDLADARQLFEQALQARRSFDDRRGIAESLFHIGLTWENKKDPSAEELRRARESHSEALKIAAAGGFDIEASYAVRHLAGHQQDAGDLDGALKGFERSLDLRLRAGYHIYLAPALLTVGDVWKAKGNPAKAREYYDRALAEAQRLGATRFQDSARAALESL
jgi:tetratricopeptide (TPR) repeat protein